MDKKIQFKTPMFVYVAERAYYPSSLKVFVPEVFLTGTNPGLSESKSQKGNTSIFLNATIPALSSYVTKYNYITLPVLNGASMVNSDGWVEKGVRCMVEFINNNPNYGIIVARC